jgi:hypothetical protein
VNSLQPESFVTGVDVMVSSKILGQNGEAYDRIGREQAALTAYLVEDLYAQSTNETTNSELP